MNVYTCSGSSGSNITGKRNKKGINMMRVTKKRGSLWECMQHGERKVKNKRNVLLFNNALIRVQSLLSIRRSLRLYFYTISYS